MQKVRNSDGGRFQVCVIMTREQIKQALLEGYNAFLIELKGLPDNSLHLAPSGKWSPAQQLEHLIKSVQPVAFAFSLPKFLLAMLLGKSNRPSRTFDDLVAKYKAKLAAGGKSSKPFEPGIPHDVPSMYKRLEHAVATLCHRMDRFSEQELDKYILPHPLLGKLTFREMLYFTAYHAGHHQQSVKAMMSKPSSTIA